MLLSRLMWNGYLAYHLCGQDRFPFKPLKAIKRLQSRRVRSMALHAYRNVPYYRETMRRLGLHPDDLQTADDLMKLPLIERSRLQRDPEYFVSESHRLDGCLKLRTGGSTGIPCTIYHDAAALFQNAAFGERERSMITPLVGRSFGYRETVIGSPTTTDKVVQDFCQARGFFPPAIRIKRQYLSLLDPPEKNLGLINDFQPDVIRSYGSYLEILFPYIYTSKRSFSSPKVVTYSSDAVSDSVRRLVVEKFNLPLLSTYEAVEAFKIGFECAQRLGVHLNIDLYPVRIVNAENQAMPDGESGDIVVSNLVNRATVLLNYRLGDLARKLTVACPCGRSLPLLSFPEGRNDEYLHLASGKVMHPQSVRTILLNEEEIWQFQVVQASASHLRVFIVAAPSVDHQRMRERLAAKFASTFGHDVTVDIVFVDSIDRMSKGKFRVVMSLLKNGRDGFPTP
jgi:phenylacetate-CoA ligase